MTRRIEDHALVGDCSTAALIARDGTATWMCLPRFDGEACFASILGDDGHGCWRLAPEAPARSERRYLPGTAVLETVHRTADGAVRVTDLMPFSDDPHRVDLLRVVEGVEGRVPMRSVLRARFGYGRLSPWIRPVGGRLRIAAGPDALDADLPEGARVEDGDVRSDFVAEPGRRHALRITWRPSHMAPLPPGDAARDLAATLARWEGWTRRCPDGVPWCAEVTRSAVTLKMLTSCATGGIVAAPTTSLPEWIGSCRNWDYRYCWLRDAAMTLRALLVAGFRDEADAWRSWLVRAIAGEPDLMQIMYGVAGERMLDERTLGWLPGHEGSAPVRIGNDAYGQRQLDVVGEVFDAFEMSRDAGLENSEDEWELQRGLMDWVERHWREPDSGLWEIRREPRRFTYSAVMAWVAADRCVRACERHGHEGPVGRWRALRDEIRAEILEKGMDPERRRFVAWFGGEAMDASLLRLPLLGFLPIDDPRIVETVRAVERELMKDGLVERYDTEAVDDGLPPGEGAFLACSFWLVECLALMGERAEAEGLFRRLIGLANDVGLLAEEYDPAEGRQLGNFPQAFSHVALIDAADRLRRTAAD